MYRRLAAALLKAAMLTGLATVPAAAEGRGPGAVYRALKATPDAELTIGGGHLRIFFADGAPGLDRALALDWLRRAATAASTYFGRFPVDEVGILVVADDGDRVRTGTTYGFRGAAIEVTAGRHATRAAFARDWVLTHEMIHLALPMMADRHLWLLEGSAVYAEPIARALAGQITAADVWRDSLAGLPRGLPGPDDRGLDQTPTWGRTYWGGALFCLRADIAIRRATAGKRSLRDAFIAINRASGGNSAFWSMAEVVAAGDAATGTTVLADLYAEMAERPAPTDLDRLFADLGVAERGGAVVFDEGAPLAALRRAITAP
ncbi:hypothetical protein [Zavarzinia compransoris]|uniref:Peptidase M61 catalytic domain-containing protein n=1 Tax=Zavarzinia compransoris TaxID=1264899 RepID=A0A317E093_9PROT|nr:hypothetical protein [Zavarzinia compransoris]PWR19854.1 hypothetical protein DKG75_15475 [Zavarzinia compransoris]TDP45035.1 hypothetical protein DES42_106257 [Zavarzinia compransoris]